MTHISRTKKWILSLQTFCINQCAEAHVKLSFIYLFSRVYKQECKIKFFLRECHFCNFQHPRKCFIKMAGKGKRFCNFDICLLKSSSLRVKSFKRIRQKERVIYKIPKIAFYKIWKHTYNILTKTF